MNRQDRLPFWLLVALVALLVWSVINPKDYFAADSSASGGYDHTHLGPKGGDAVAGFVRDAINANPGVPALVPYLR